jgi:hypothetical protein
LIKSNLHRKMKKILFYSLLLTTITSFSQTKIMNGLGKAKIGMSILDFNAVFGTSIQNTKLSIQRDALRLEITDDIVIKNVTYGFQKQKLIFIKCDYNNFLFKGLKHVYDLQYISKTKLNETFYQLKTSSSKITCLGLLDNEIIVFDNAIRTDKVLLELAAKSMKEFDKIRTYKGL